MNTDDNKEQASKILVVEERLTNYMKRGDEFREDIRHGITNLDEKIDQWIDKINGKFEKLPCKERDGWYRSMSRQVTLMWGVLIVLICGILVEWFKKR